MSGDPKPASLADRITMPASTPAAQEAKPAAATSTWADEVASPTGNTAKEGEGSLATAQLDGQVETLNGSGLQDGQYEVEVKLSDIQGDANSPLHSVNSFEQLGM